MGTADANGILWGWRAKDWATIQEMQIRPVYQAVLSKLALEPSHSVLDVGCGAGLFLSMVAERGLRPSGLDASAALLAIARERVKRADLRIGEMEALPFAAESFEVVTGFNSFQFAWDPAAALCEAKRVAKTGAAIVIVVWGKPEAMEAANVVAALGPLMPPRLPGTPSPLVLSDEVSLRNFAETAGLAPMEVGGVDSPWTYPNLATALRGLMSSGSAKRAIDHTSEEKVIKVFEAAVRPFIRDDGTVHIGTSFLYLIARV